MPLTADLTTDGPIATVRVTFGASSASGGAEARARAVEARARAVERCVAALVAAGIGVREARPSDGSLEEVFATLTREAPAPDVASPAGPAGSGTPP
jgi:hypothetical protein